MPLLQYRIVDVFTTEVLEGNALAVFTHASQIDEAIMQKIAREMNLAETTTYFGTLIIKIDESMKAIVHRGIVTAALAISFT